MIKNIIIQAQQSNEKAMLILIDKFKPLLKGYARKLNCEDAYEDILLFFIELINSFKIDRLSTTEDSVIVSYINTSVRNFYYKKISVLVMQRREIVLSNLPENQFHFLESKLSRRDEQSFMLEMGIKEILNTKEYEIIYKIFVKGYTSTEIAHMSNKSKQAVNQMKRRALSKIKEYMELKY